MPIYPARIALVVALLVSLHAGAPTATHVIFYVALGVLLAISTRRPVGFATILVLLIGGLVIRLAWSDRIGSDTLYVTKAAIDRVLVGLNPYGYHYEASSPPGAPFPYGPLAILLYMPFHQVASFLELLSGATVATVLAVQGRLVGLAVYAAAPIVVAVSTDGSNDTTLGLLILAAFMAGRRWPALGGFLLACAVAFKLSALAFVPGFLAWAGGRVAVAFLAGSLIAWAPVLSTWGIRSFIDSVSRANALSPAVIWSLGTVVKELTGQRLEILDTLRLAFGGVIALLGLRLRSSMNRVILVGCAVYLVTLYGGNWATYAYFGGIAPIICWRLDEWLGLESRSVPDRLRELRRNLAAKGAAKAAVETEVEARAASA
ncbi:MAG: hypothetical protein ABIR64_00100 [Candidatus Limnocylindrales bacterium]